MTPDIERLAKEAGMHLSDYGTVSTKGAGSCLNLETLTKFAALIAEECAKEAAMFSIRKKPIHPDITFDEMPEINRCIVHATCQCVAEEIRAKFALSNDKPEAK